MTKIWEQSQRNMKCEFKALCASFEGERRSWAKKCGWLLDNGKGKEMDFSPEDFKKEHSPSNNLGFSPVRPI